MAGRADKLAGRAARPWFSVTPAALARALTRLATEDALSLPLLDAPARRRLTAATSRLPFRPARPVVGEGANAVYQEFDLCMPIPGGSLFHDFAAAVETLVNKALAAMPAPPLVRPFRFNDLIVQRYERGALGITAHRDHRRYEGLIALVSLSGAARFFVCADRAGHDAREVPAPPGSLVLMRGPGYAGRADRPFHFVRDIGRRRLSLGLRHDTNVAGTPASRPMQTADFDFELPRAHIAQHPAVPRDAARLLVVGEADLADRRIRDLPALLSPGDLLVCNDTRVIPTRLFGRRGEVKIEATLHRRETAAAGGGTAIRWRAFARPARRLRPGDRVDFAADFHATVAEKGDGGEVTLTFDLSEADLAAALQRHGAMPLPPYIARARGGDPRDRRDYQTIFAAHDGAVAAPTAGLHFTPDLLRALDARGIARSAVTLHVGAGTFLPVTADDPRQHRMHAEVGEITPAAAEAVNAAREAGGRVVAVGSTALRLLETAADAQGRIRPFTGETDIFILPGYRFRAVDRLLTNFHLPRSTLYMLVCAFAGMERMQRAYAHAIAHGYRFYSYGDACLLTRAAE